MIAEFGAQYGFHVIPTISSLGYKFPGIQPIREKLTIVQCAAWPGATVVQATLSIHALPYGTAPECWECY